MIKRLTPSLSWLLLIVLVFQVSLLPVILNMRGTARVANAIALATFMVMALRANYRRVSAAVFFFFVLPAGLVLVGYAINVLRSVDLQTIGRLGMLLPWCAALSVPFMESYSLEASWLVFYRFMLISSAVSCVEYWAVFSGILATKPVESVYGSFSTGIFTIYVRLPDGSPYYRMLGVFPEPGTLAMWLIPAIAYALVFRKRLGLLVFPVTLYLSQSLGGFASAVVLVGSFTWWRTRRLFVRVLMLALLGAGVAYFAGEFFVSTYVSKAASATVREDNAFLFWGDLGRQIANHPLGTPLIGNSLSELGTFDRDYLGSNFAPYTALILGGVSALIGYSAMVAVALFTSMKFFARPHADRLMACAFISLPPLILFLFQRGTIFDSPLFAFLVAAPMLAVIRGEEAVTLPSGARSRSGDRRRRGRRENSPQELAG
jgi:hypothetical protein